MNRRKAREGAFLILFQYSFQPDELQHITDGYFKAFEADTQEEYIRNVVFGTVAHLAEIDQKITAFSKGWSVDRISVVSLAVMRLCIYEMLYCADIPPAVSVNEAVSLARKYEGEEATAFVNGILGNIKEIC